MLPPAPGRLSTTIGCFKRSSILLATRRVKTSSGPPAVDVARMRTGLAGYGWAATGKAHAAAHKNARVLIIDASHGDMGEHVEHARIRDHFVVQVQPMAGALHQAVFVASDH